MYDLCAALLGSFVCVYLCLANPLDLYQKFDRKGDNNNIFHGHHLVRGRRQRDALGRAAMSCFGVDECICAGVMRVDSETVTLVQRIERTYARRVAARQRPPVGRRPDREARVQALCDAVVDRRRLNLTAADTVIVFDPRRARTASARLTRSRSTCSSPRRRTRCTCSTRRRSNSGSTRLC